MKTERKPHMKSIDKTTTTIAAEEADLTDIVTTQNGKSVRSGEILQQIASDAAKENGEIKHRQTQFAPPWFNPTNLARRSFLSIFPFSYATGAANNP